MPAESRAPEKKQAFADVSIRKHRPGPHRIVLLVNGAEVAQCVIEVAGSPESATP